MPRPSRHLPQFLYCCLLHCLCRPLQEYPYYGRSMGTLRTRSHIERPCYGTLGSLRNAFGKSYGYGILNYAFPFKRPFTAFHPACNYLRPGRTLHRSLRGAPTKHGLPAVVEKGRLGFTGSRSRGLGWIWHCKAWAFRVTIGFGGMRGHYRMRG